MEEKIHVFQESELDQVQLSSSPGIEPLLDRVKKEILKKAGQAALLADVVKELSNGDGDSKQHSALAGKFKRYCEKGTGGFKIVSKDGRNVLVRTT
jgi:hypothetical protein